MKSRINLIGYIFVVLVLIIGVRAINVQVFLGGWLSKKAANIHEVSYKKSGKRGTIYDKYLNEFAISTVVSSISADPQKIIDPKATAKKLAKVLMIDEIKLADKLSSGKKFVWIKRKVAPKVVAAIKKYDISGIEFIPEYKRFYPSKMLAAQAIGFTGIDDQGLEGIEYYYNSILNGTTSELTVLRDALGRNFDSNKKGVSGYTGKNLVLTIDTIVQHFAEKAIQEAVTKYSAKSGIAIVMHPDTGAILALAHFPFFNPNTLGNFGQEQWRNRAITDSYEPGSTMKIFSAASALESGASSINSIFNCENGSYRIGKQVIHDTHKYNWLSLQEIIKYSSNIGTVKFSTITGPKFLYETLSNFGFNTKTGIDCPGETRGRLSPYKKWAKIDAATISFGQGILVSPIQLISATSAIANGGILMRPYIAKAITNQHGDLVKKIGPTIIRRAISSHTAETITNIMQTVVEEGGTGTNGALETYSACGKTGTAQKIDEDGRYSNDKYVSSFVGFAPVENPKIAVLVVIDEPTNEHYGGIVAAPVFRNISQQTLDYLNTTLPQKDKPNRLK